MAKIGFIGMGNMGSAILKGLLKVYAPRDMMFTAAHQEKMDRSHLRQRWPTLPPTGNVRPR